MERNDPPHDAGSAPAGDPTDDALRRLEDRLDRASHAAERLIAEAAAQAAASPGSRTPPRPPPAGWQTEDGASDAGPGTGGDVELLAQVVKSLRELIPADLQLRLTEAVREVLLAVRALIDWYLERAEHQRTAPVEVQDIPIA